VSSPLPTYDSNNDNHPNNQPTNQATNYIYIMEDITAAASLSLGDSYHVDENYTEAIDAYAAAVSVVRDFEADLHIRSLSHRSAAFYHLGRYEESLEDATAALTLLSQAPSGLRPGEGELCHKRHGLAAFKLERYTDAKEALQQAAQLASLNNRSNESYLEWIRQCDEQLSPSKRPKVETEKSLSASVSGKATASVSAVAAVPAAIPSAPTSTPAIPTPTLPVADRAKRPTMPKYQYYQNDKIMTIAILESNVKQSDLHVVFQSKRLTVILTKGGVDFTVIAGYLYSKIDTEKSKVTIKDEKVLLKLRKVEEHEWHELFGKPDDDEEKSSERGSSAKKAPATQPATAALAAATQNPVSTPTSADMDTTKTRPYASHRDWDAIEKDLEKQEKQEKPEGDEALNALFKQIYSNADEATRRAMVKSYQTSGGTVLSTNWDEVGKKDYEKERTAPKGMEWKNWEGDKLPMKDDDL
jgi:tetratricopeptide (TPR) repeat protein